MQGDFGVYFHKYLMKKLFLFSFVCVFLSISLNFAHFALRDLALVEREREASSIVLLTIIIGSLNNEIGYIEKMLTRRNGERMGGKVRKRWKVSSSEKKNLLCETFLIFVYGENFELEIIPGFSVIISILLLARL